MWDPLQFIRHFEDTMQRYAAINDVAETDDWENHLILSA